MRLSDDVARGRFAAARIMRLATVGEGGRPHLVPAAFAVERDCVYTAVDQKPKDTRELRRLRNIRANPAIAALADHYDDDWNRLWWVRADGAAEIVTDPREMAGPLELLAARYPQYRAEPPDGPLIVITVTRWSGWAASNSAG